MPETKTTKLSLELLIDLMEDRHAIVARRVLEDYRQIIEVIPGSSTKHQAWPGGYVSHVEEAMNIGLLLHRTLSDCRPLDVSLSSSLFCIYMHDFDKVQRYSVQPDGTIKAGAYSADYLDKTAQILLESYDYTLTDEEYNALKYAHGEGDDYHPTDRIMFPLATVVHCADIISARIWYDDGHEHDTW